jgi:hypothetical protein
LARDVVAHGGSSGLSTYGHGIRIPKGTSDEDADLHPASGENRAPAYCGRCGPDALAVAAVIAARCCHGAPGSRRHTSVNVGQDAKRGGRRVQRQYDRSAGDTVHWRWFAWLSTCQLVRRVITGHAWEWGTAITFFNGAARRFEDLRHARLLLLAPCGAHEADPALI